MINILYQVGDTVWREEARQVFSIRISQKDEEGNDKPACAIACVKEDEMVNIFLKETDRIEDCNDVIINAINEIDLRGHRLFASHTLEDFKARMEASIKTVDHEITKDGTIQTVPSTIDPVEEEPAEEKATEEAPADEAATEEEATKEEETTEEATEAAEESGDAPEEEAPAEEPAEEKAEE